MSELGEKDSNPHFADQNRADCHYPIPHRDVKIASQSQRLSGRRGPIAPPGETRAKVLELLAQGLTGADVARQLGIGRSTVAYHKARSGKPIDKRFGRRYDWAEVQRYHDAGHSTRECMRHFGFSSQTWHKARKRGALVTRPAAAPIAEILSAGRKRSRGHVKARLIAAGLKTKRCEECGITGWRDRPLSLELHHVNGDGDDNRLENLRLLCPNCHSQTDTWGGRNTGRVPRRETAA